MLKIETTLEENAIEHYVSKKINKLKKYPFSKDGFKLLTILMLTEDNKLDNDIADIIKKSLGLQIFKTRLESLGYEISNKCVIVFSDAILTPGIAVLYVYFIAYKMKQHNLQKLEINELCSHIIPMGLPSQQDLNIIWDEQKVERLNDGTFNSDNLVDYETAAQSLIYKNIF
jgi:hypothetical protein